MKKDPFNNPKLINFMEQQTIEHWKQVLDGFRDATLFAPQHKEAYYACENEATIQRLIVKFEKQYNQKLKYRQIPPSLLFYVSYEETVLGPEYDRTVLNKHLE